MHTSATRQSERRSVWSVWPGPAIVRGAWHPGCHGGRSGHPWGYCRVAAGGIGLGHRSGGCVAAGPGQVAPDGRGSGRGGVERVPQLQEGLGRVAPKAPSPAAALAVRPWSQPARGNIESGCCWVWWLPLLPVHWHFWKSSKAPVSQRLRRRNRRQGRGPRITVQGTPA